MREGLALRRGHHFVLFPWSSLAVFELLEQTGHTRAGEPLADIHPGVQPEGGGHHTPAPGQDAPAPETHCVSVLRAAGPGVEDPPLPPAVANLAGVEGAPLEKPLRHGCHSPSFLSV